MRRIYFLFIIISLLVSGCSKKGKTSSSDPAAGRHVSSGESVFVTERPAKSGKPDDSKPGKANDPKPAKPEVVIPVTFPEKETEHVRIVNYDPFGKEKELAICLDELQDNFCYPHPGNKISDYGMRGRAMHTGVDIKAQPNDTVRAALSGVVRMSKNYSSYGNIVVLRHSCGLETVYAHNSKNLVQPNQIVFAGDPIALAGRTGRATTEHVHFEVRVMGEHFDPNLFLDTQNKCIKGGDLYLARQNGRILASGSSSASRSLPADNPVLIAENTRTTPVTVSVQEPVVQNQQPANRDTEVQRPSENAPSVYEVKKGDTYYSISRRFGLTVSELCALNGVRETDVLRIGQKLKVK